MRDARVVADIGCRPRENSRRPVQRQSREDASARRRGRKQAGHAILRLAKQKQRVEPQAAFGFVREADKTFERPVLPRTPAAGVQDEPPPRQLRL